MCVFSGFPLNDQLFQMIIRRYSDENGNMDFDNYIGCLVRLDAMCRKFTLWNETDALKGEDLSGQQQRQTDCSFP